MPNLIPWNSWTLEMRIQDTAYGQRTISGMVWHGTVRVKVCPPPAETESGPQFRIGQRLMKDFDLEEDGSLDLRKVGQHWGFERALIYDSERETWFEPMDPFKLGALAVEVLSEPTGFLTIIEYQNTAIAQRKDARQAELDLMHLLMWWLFRKGFPFFAMIGAFFYMKYTSSSWSMFFVNLVICCLVAVFSHVKYPKPIIKTEFWIEKAEKYDYLL